MVSTQYGGEQRTYFLLSALERIAEVDVLALTKTPPPPEVRRFQNVIYVSDPRFNKHRLEYWLDLILRKTRLFSFAAVPSFFWARKVISRLQRQKHYDCIVTRFCHVTSRMMPWRFAPLVLDVDDLPLEVYATKTAKCVPKCFAGIGLYAVSKWFKWMERNSLICFLSNQAHVSRIADHKGYYVRNVAMPIPPSYDFDFPPQNKLIMVGSFGHYPNAEGVRRFVCDRWPSVRKRFPGLQLHIIGGGATQSDIALFQSLPDVVYRGFVENLDEEYQTALASVADIYSGSGTCIKVVESVTHGRPCIVSEFAARGVPSSWFENGWLSRIENITEVVGKLISMSPRRPFFPREIPGYTERDFQDDVKMAFEKAGLV